jgi:hypothetical protein
MRYPAFRKKCSCTLENALDILREDSKRKHIFIAVDDFTRIGYLVETSSERLLEDFTVQIAESIDSSMADRRVNVVLTSPSSVPRMNLERVTGRKFVVN